MHEIIEKIDCAEKSNRGAMNVNLLARISHSKCDTDLVKRNSRAYPVLYITTTMCVNDNNVKNDRLPSDCENFNNLANVTANIKTEKQTGRNKKHQIGKTMVNKISVRFRIRFVICPAPLIIPTNVDHMISVVMVMKAQTA